MKNAVHSIKLSNGRTYKYMVEELSTDLTLPGGKVLTVANWDIKGVRERWYRDEYVNPEVHYNQPKETEVVEFGIKTEDVKRYIEEGIKRNEDLFDPILPGQVAEGANA
jgi:hypothetical protein